MHAEKLAITGEANPAADQRVIIHGITWWQYEAFLAARGDRSGLRIYYLEGALELVSPSNNHERIKKQIARLVEAYADELGVDLTGVGSWTLKNPLAERGAEPDECYVLGVEIGTRPDIAIEVNWTRGGLDKLEIYRKLDVREVWVWEDYEIRVFSLRGEQYEQIPKSELMPDVDMALLAKLGVQPNQPQAVRELRAIIRSR
jgi:Uma2 family endonuclease